MHSMFPSIFTALLLLFSATIQAATEEEIDAFMIKVVQDTIPQLPIIVDDQSRTTSMFYDTADNVLIYGVEVSIEGDFNNSQLIRTREKARAFTARGACENADARNILNIGVDLHYRYQTATNQRELFDYTITASDCGISI